MILGTRFPVTGERHTKEPATVPTACSDCIITHNKESIVRIGRYCRDVVLAKLGAITIHSEEPGGEACKSLQEEARATVRPVIGTAAEMALREGFGHNGPARF